jgi:hypothetical protein
MWWYQMIVAGDGPTEYTNESFLQQYCKVVLKSTLYV